MPLSESPDRDDEETPTKQLDLPPKAMTMLAAMEDAAAELVCAIRQDGTGSAETAFEILSYAVSVARGDDTYQDAAGAEWPVGIPAPDAPAPASDVEKAGDAPESALRNLLANLATLDSFEDGEDAEDHGYDLETVIANWKKNYADTLSGLLPTPEPSDDPGELKENEDFARDNLPEPRDDND